MEKLKCFYPDKVESIREYLGRTRMDIAIKAFNKSSILNKKKKKMREYMSKKLIPIDKL